MWVERESLRTKFKRIFRLSEQKECYVGDMVRWREGGWSWELKWNRPLRSREEDHINQLLMYINMSQIPRDKEDI